MRLPFQCTWLKSTWLVVGAHSDGGYSGAYRRVLEVRCAIRQRFHVQATVQSLAPYERPQKCAPLGKENCDVRELPARNFREPLRNRLALFAACKRDGPFPRIRTDQERPIPGSGRLSESLDICQNSWTFLDRGIPHLWTISQPIDQTEPSAEFASRAGSSVEYE